jgi:gluconolactonase
VFLQPSGYTGNEPYGSSQGSNGLVFDPQGRLVLCQHGDRRIVRLEPDGSFTTLAEYYKWRRFNSPNDAVYKSNGDLYFTDPPYGLPKGNEDSRKELINNAVYRLDTNGEVTRLTTRLSYPNGIAFSPDERTLYVANSDPDRAIWMAFPVLADGTLGDGRTFFDATAMTENQEGLPDGMTVDQRGNLFATGPGGVLVLTPRGEHLGTIKTGQATSNCAWGDNGSTLYMTADMILCRIHLRTLGVGFQVEE